MPYFAFATTQTIRRIKLIEAPSEDDAWSRIREKQGEQIYYDYIDDEDFWDQKDLTKEEFEAKQVPDEWR